MDSANTCSSHPVWTEGLCLHLSSSCSRDPERWDSKCEGWWPAQLKETPKGQYSFPKNAEQSPSLSTRAGADTTLAADGEAAEGLFRDKADILGFQQQEVCRKSAPLVSNFTPVHPCRVQGLVSSALSRVLGKQWRRHKWSWQHLKAERKNQTAPLPGLGDFWL